MIDKKSLLHLKSATVGIGVISILNPSKPELEVFGTGFFLSCDGWVMTAKHVTDECLKLVRFRMSKKIDVNLVAVQLIFLHDGNFKVTHIPMESPIELTLIHESDGKSVGKSIDLDAVILRPKESKERDKPFLKIKKPSSIDLFDDIVMCGYPSGKHSLNLSDETLITTRLSPVLQFGKVAGLRPFDTAEYPYAIQTDIIGTGGSSGSPIVKVDSSEVIAMAQEVLPAGVGGDAIFVTKDNPEVPLEGKIGAISNIGLTVGISHNMLDGFPEGIRKQLQEGIPYKDYPKFTYVGRGTWSRG